MWNKIKDYLTNEESKELDEAIHFLRSKTAKVDSMLREISNDENEVIKHYYSRSRFSRYTEDSILNRACLYTLDREWKYAYQCIIGCFLSNMIDYYVSQERFDKLKEVMTADAKKSMARKEYMSAFHALLSIGETKYILENGCDLCFDNPDDLYQKRIHSDDPSDDDRIFKSAFFFLGIGLYDRAVPLIEALKEFRKQPYAGARSGAYFIRLYDKMTDFLENIYLARTSENREDSKKYAAKAILDNINAVVENYGDDEASYFKCHDIVPVIALLIEFEFNDLWSQQCIRTLLPIFHHRYFLKVFQKVFKYDLWFDSPGKYGMSSFEEINRIKNQLRS